MAQAFDDEDDDPLADPYDPGIDVDSGGDVRLFRRGGGGRVIRCRDQARVDATSLKLAETSTNLLNLDALEEDHPELGPILAPIRDQTAFEDLFLSTEEDKRRPLSRDMDVHLSDLKRLDILNTDAAAVAPLALLVLVWCTLFLVPKKDKGLGRLVIDARPINRRQRRPPDMNLPRMADVIRQVLSWNFAASCDGKSFFYQFPLAPGVARYFRTRIAGRRGGIIEGILKRLPMGWSFSPCIAQRVANALMKGLGVAWVDDFIMGATSLEEFELRRSELRRRLNRYNIEVDDDSLPPSTLFEALGLEFDLQEKRYRVSARWVEKRSPRWTEILEALKNADATFRDLFELYGALIWADYVCDQPLWMRAEALHALKSLAVKVEGNYDAKIQPGLVPSALTGHLYTWIGDVEANPWRTPVTRPPLNEADAILFSDASSTGGAWIRVFRGQVTNGRQWLFQEDMHIYFRELDAMCAAASEGRRLENELHVVDNTAVVGAATRGHSSSLTANKVLRDTFGRRKPWVVWAPTDRQLADPFTRGESIPSLPVPLSTPQQQVIASLDAQGVPDSKRNTQPVDCHLPVNSGT